MNCNETKTTEHFTYKGCDITYDLVGKNGKFNVHGTVNTNGQPYKYKIITIPGGKEFTTETDAENHYEHLVKGMIDRDFELL